MCIWSVPNPASAHLIFTAVFSDFELAQCYGEEAAFVSAGGYHHHLRLNTCKSRSVATTNGHDRLDHFALLYPTRAALAAAMRRLSGPTFLLKTRAIMA